MVPLRNASAMARGTSASAMTKRSAIRGHLGLHFLLGRDRFGAASLGLRAGHARVGLGLIGLQPGADVLADIDVGDVDRDDGEGRVRVQARVRAPPA